jgi:hypothetical protein
VGRRPTSSSGIRGRKASSSFAEEASSSHAGEGKLLLPGQGATVRTPPRRRPCRLTGRLRPGPPASSAAQHVVRREGGTRVLGRPRSCSRGENGSEDLPVRFGAAAARWCGVGGRQRRFRRRDRRRHPRSDLRLFGFDGLSSPLEWGCGRGPSYSSVCPEVIAAAV